MLLEQARKRIQNYRPRPLPANRSYPEAAVLVPLTRSATPELLLTLKAQGLSTHSGEVAFPGGMRDPEDPDLAFTALRESQEEVGLNPAVVEIAGPLSPLLSRHGLKVTPYVGMIPDQLGYHANEAEIDSIFSVPLEFFVTDPRQTTHRLDYLGQSWYVPSYTYADYKIWGLTAVMVVELMNVIFGRQLDLRQPPQLSTKEL